MNLSRSRQFGDYRSQANSRYSENKSLRSSQASISAPSQACFNCVNTILAQRKREQQKKQKEDTRQSMQLSIKLLNSIKDPQIQYRNELKKDALVYNSKMINEHQKHNKKQIQEDKQYAEQVKKQVEQAEQIYHHQIQQQKKRQREFYKELKNQYIETIHHKDQNRFAPKQNGYSEGLPLYNTNKREQIISYQKELKSQIFDKEHREKQLKAKETQLQRQKLLEFQQQAQKYHADNYDLGQKKNVELLSQLKNSQHKKQQEQQQKKKTDNQMRLEMIRRDNQQKSRMMKQKMSQMQSYVEGLKNQMLQKQQKMRNDRFRESAFVQKIPKSQEQIARQLLTKKQCKGCHKQYPVDYIGKVPKKI